VSKQVVVGNLPQQPPGFQLRADLLAQLDRAGPVSVVHAADGLPGVGTTQLAAAYTRAGGWRLVGWVSAGNPASLQAGLAAVAEALNLTGHGPRRGGADPAREVRQRLEADGAGCLIVFDGATDPDMLRPVIPAAGAARVLITSSWKSAAGLGTGVSLEVFSPEEAVTFLSARTGLTGAPGANAVAAALDYLPLALAQAAATIAAERLSYRKYLKRLRSAREQDPLERGASQPGPHTAAGAVLLSLDAVRAADGGDVAAGVMEIAAVLSAAGVRRDLLHAAGQAGLLARRRRWPGAAPDVVDRALDRLAEWSLLTFTLDGSAIIVHPLVMRVIRDSQARRGRLRATCLAAVSLLNTLAAALAASTDRPAARDITQQVAALQQNVVGLADDSDDVLASSLLALRLWVLYHLNELGDSTTQAIAAGEPLLADLERTLGPGHPDTLSARNSLAIAYRAAGRVAEAISLHEQTLAARERIRGPDHPSTLGSRSNLAIAYQAAGRHAEAITLYERVLTGLERVRGPDHPDTRAARNTLAAAYRAAGRVGEAIALHEQALAGLERVRGPDHPSTLGLRSNLANAYRAAGRVGEAIALHEQALAGRERVLGPDHPDTLSSRNNLANAYRAAGRLGEAIALHEQALAGRERVLGPDHPDTLSSRDNLAIAYRDAAQAS
jgi:tetratricopeptide (TPR) repeat protein